MSYRLKKISILVLAHYLFYPFYLGFINIRIQQLIIFGSLALYVFFNMEKYVGLFKSIRVRKRPFLISSTLYALILMLMIIIPILYQTYDFSYLTSYLRNTFYMLTYIVLVGMIRSHLPGEDIKDQFMNFFSVATRNYVLFTILLVLINPLRDFWLSFIFETPSRISLMNHPGYFARVGWTGYSGYSVTVFCTIAVLFSIYLILKSIEETNRIPKRYIINLFFALIGNAFYGRSGLLVSLVLITFGIIYIVIFNQKIHYAIFIAVGLVIVFIFLTILKEFSSTLANWYDWMMQPFVSLLETGSIQTTSTDTLWEMWFIPDFSFLLFGNGYYTSPLPQFNYYMSTDVGYIRPVLFSGIFFAFLTYLIPIILSFAISSVNAKRNKLLALMFLFTIFVLEVKAETVILLTPILFTLFISEFTDISKKNKAKLKLNGLGTLNYSQVVMDK